MAHSTFVLFAMLAVAAALVTPRHGCKKVSLLHRGDPADSTTIDGDDCGNVKQIVGKWAKAKKVGELAGASKAAQMGADLAATNTDDAVARAEATGKKVGLKDKIPEGVKLAAEEAKKASTAATKAGSDLKVTTDTFKGKFADFAKDITDADITKIKQETTAAVVASEDAIKAANRALAKAADAKKKAMKSTAGALKLIEATLADSAKLSKQVGEASQQSTFATKDTGDLIANSKKATTKIDAKIATAKEQAPVWEAYKSDLQGRESAADTSKKAVETAVADLKTAAGDMDTNAKKLQVVKDNAQAAPNLLLGQSKNIDTAEASIRKTETAFAALKMKVQSLTKDAERLAAKIKDTNKRLKD